MRTAAPSPCDGSCEADRVAGARRPQRAMIATNATGASVLTPAWAALDDRAQSAPPSRASAVSAGSRLGRKPPCWSTSCASRSRPAANGGSTCAIARSSMLGSPARCDAVSSLGSTSTTSASRTRASCLRLRRSKTNQEGELEEVAVLYGSDPRTCPVRALQAPACDERHQRQTAVPRRRSRRTREPWPPHRAHRRGAGEEDRRAQWARSAQVRRALAAQRFRDVGGSGEQTRSRGHAPRALEEHSRGAPLHPRRLPLARPRRRRHRTVALQIPNKAEE
jgi:hypothetical protein